MIEKQSMRFSQNESIYKGLPALRLLKKERKIALHPCGSALEKEMNYYTLEQAELHVLHSAFVAAFSDYHVPVDISFADFQKMMRRRGLVSELSVGAFDGEKLIGFSLTGLRMQNGMLTAYDIATGIAPEYRRQGITSEIFVRQNAILKEKQAAQYLLEVIKENLPAVRLYQKQGFQIQRELSCFQIDQKRLVLGSKFQTEKTGTIDWEQGKTFWDFDPSWQNSVASVSAVPEAFIHVIARLSGEFAGYGLIDPKTGDVPQLAVSPKFRRLGIGSSILAELAMNAEVEKIRLINIESSQDTVLAFLAALGFEHYVSQYEMVMPIR